MKRSGFTMIELIFVIVIIGILAAVAIPKLAATRDDAQISESVANLRTCVQSAYGTYTATQKVEGIDAPWSPACLASNDCFNYLANTPTVAQMTVGFLGNSDICQEAQKIAFKLGLASSAGVIHKLGGRTVQR